MRLRTLTLAAVAAALVVPAAPTAAVAKPKAADTGAIVCNEAENSWRGGYTVSGGPVDPNPPAFLRGSQMRVGNGVGLVHAAERSPALRLCSPTVVPTDPTDAVDPVDPVDPIDPTDPTDPGDGGGVIIVAY